MRLGFARGILLAAVSVTAVLAAVLPMAGCDAPATQLVVVVDTDFDVTSELGVVEVRVFDRQGAEISRHEFALAPEGEAAGPAQFTLPLSFGVVPLDGDAGRRIAVEVTGRTAGDEPLVQRRAVTGFIDEEQLLLPMFLARSCQLEPDGGPVCPEGQTCTEMGCEDDEVPPNSLRVVRPGEEIDGVLDAGTDAGGQDGGGVDAAASDAGADDAGTMDAGGTDGGSGGGEDAGGALDAGSGTLDAGFGCTEDVTCNADRCSCATDCCRLTCTEATCEPTCNRDGSCAVDARGVESVNVDCGMRTRCAVDAREAGTVRVSCFMSECDVHCDGAEDCELSCGNMAGCLLRCMGTGRCTYTDCGGDVMSCPDNVIACGRECP